MENPERCVLCDGESYELVLTGRDRMRGLPGEFRVMRCMGCGLCRTEPRIPEEERAKYYEPEEQVQAGKATRIGIYQKRLADRLQRALGRSSGKRVLDIGCGQGVFLEMMRDRGFEVCGVELGEESSRIAREERGLSVVTGDLSDLDVEKESFDAVLMSHLIEHVEDPIALLERVRDLLRPGGVALLSLPNYRCIERRVFGANWYPWCLPVHLYHFDKHSIRRAAERAGLIVEKITYLPFFFLVQNTRYALKKDGQATGGGTGDALKTTVFKMNLAVSGMLGRLMPGEIMEIEIRKAALPQTKDEREYAKTE